MYVKRGLSYREITDDTGISQSSIDRWGKQDGWPAQRTEYEGKVRAQKDERAAVVDAIGDLSLDALKDRCRGGIDFESIDALWSILGNAKSAAKDEIDPYKQKQLVDVIVNVYGMLKPMVEIEDDKATRKRLEIVVVQEAIEKPQEVKDIESALTGTDDERST